MAIKIGVFLVASLGFFSFICIFEFAIQIKGFFLQWICYFVLKNMKELYILSIKFWWVMCKSFVNRFLGNQGNISGL